MYKKGWYPKVEILKSLNVRDSGFTDQNGLKRVPIWSTEAKLSPLKNRDFGLRMLSVDLCLEQLKFFRIKKFLSILETPSDINFNPANLTFLK